MPIQHRFTHSFQNRAVHRAQLSNGMVVLSIENPAADIVSCRMFVRAGGRTESLRQAGISHLLASVMTKGTQTRSAHDIADYVESMGASLGTDATADYSLLSFKTVSSDVAEILALAAELLRSPSFPDAEVDLEKRLTLQGLRSMQEQPFAIAQHHLRQRMYPNHPYAHPILGTEKTVQPLMADDLRHYHHTYFRPDNMVVSVSGRLAADDAIALIDHYLGDWQAPQQDGQPVPLMPPDIEEICPRATTSMIPEDTQQSVIMLGYLGSSVRSDDYLVLKLLNTYLGNGLSSRLFVELREKRGLAYEVSAFYPTRLHQSQFVAYMGTAPSNTQQALDGLQHEVTRLGTIQLEPEALQSAKNKLLGQYALGKQTNAQLAQIFGWYETLGLGLEFDQRFQDGIAAITPEQAQDVAQRYFVEPYVSIVGQPIAVGA